MEAASTDGADADVNPAVVLIRSRACGAIAAGSGVAVAERRVLTARHVVEGSTSILVNGISAEASQLDPVADAAIVSEPANGAGDGAADAANGGAADEPAAIVPATNAMVLATTDLRPGAAVTLVGWASGQRQETVAGRVATVRRAGELGEGAPVVTVTADGVVPGFSGGALVDAAGRLAGIITAVESPTGLVLAVPASRLRHLLVAKALPATAVAGGPSDVSRCR
jgi:S1-C subfamily serine protease